MTGPAAGDEAACLAALEVALDSGTLPDLSRASAAVLDKALKRLARLHGARAGDLLRRLADAAPAK
ncbi:MAG TPA: hypothetical protein VFN71_04565, partial [Methylomirabilota bacterium]|nr:hypothetical protein [Methylomirabilota bacterium]